MNGENVKNNDPLQLQQMIIFLKAELAKYKYEVKKYQDSYHYSLAEKLEQENVQLTNDNKELSEELYKLKQAFEQRTSDYKVSIHLQEMEKEKYIASIDNLRKIKTDLRPINKQLTEVIKKMKDGVNTNQYWYLKHDKQVTSFHKRLGDNKTSIEQLEYKLVDLIQKENKQVHSQLEKLAIANKERIQSEKVRQQFLIEIEEKNTTIGKLQHEISNLKKQNEKQSETIEMEEKSLKNKTIIEQLEYKLVDLIQKENKQVYSQLEKLAIANKERIQSEKVRQRFLIEIKEKNTAIGKLQHEISNLKEQNEKQSEAITMLEKNLNPKNDRQVGIDSFSSTPTIDTETLIQLDHQIKEVVAKTLDYEEKLDAKLLVVNTLEQKLDQLTDEIDGIKIFSVEGRVLKEF